MTSKIKVDNITNQSDSNIVNKCGTTITLGASGDTINLASGASQTGFGRTGTVDWDTTPKTAGFTAVSGNGYFVNTTSGAITMNLPATPSAGDIVSIKDYAFTFATNNFIVDGNGSPIGGVTGTVPVTYTTNGTSKTFIYVDGTKGWLVTNESTDTSQEANPTFICATGGTITTCGDYKIHTFTGPGTFCVSSLGNPEGGPNSVNYLVVAGGGSGPWAGGGAGGYRVSADTSALPVSVQGYSITVGGGGGATAYNAPGNNGSNSVFSSITSAGGGGGARFGNPGFPGNPGGSGGGGGGQLPGSPGAGGSGNTPPVSPSQGNNGGSGSSDAATYTNGGGGGGAGGVGVSSSGQSPTPGGIGKNLHIPEFGAAPQPFYPVPTGYFSGGGGGGGGAYNAGNPLGGDGGGGGLPAGNGTTNSGGGAGGPGGSGGSGIVIIRYKFQ